VATLDALSIRSPALRRDAARSYGDRRAENLLVHADNLVALEWLRPRFDGRFRCVYFDPPFNTGRIFAEYSDRLSPEAWRKMIALRLEAARPLLADDGAIFVEIDDTELAHLQLAMDDVFGRDNRVSTITVVRSAGTGHKAINRGPVNVTDYLLVYAKDKSRWRSSPQWRARTTYDRAYGTFLVNRSAPPSSWEFVPLRAAAGRALGVPKPTRAMVESFAIDHAESVVRFAQPRYEAVSGAARACIDRSVETPDQVIHLVRAGKDGKASHKDMYLRAGNRVLFLADKVRVVLGERVLVEPLTNVWDDVPFQGIAKEGGVVFTRNKKPERLLARIVAMTTEPGDWVLDAFLGSGTTAAVAHKMGRRWVGIESGDHVDLLCLPRMRRVVDGADKAGITRECDWQGGGGFHVHA
jgi:adenine-specific DNA-methyltransferase